MSSPRLPYAAALDGLRAVAVLMVVAYHLDAPWARGGFLGVDLFFVISGFLITTLLLRESAAAGRIDLGAFWVRRFRRLVPPLVVMVTATVVATRLFGAPERWAATRADAFSALGYVANWRFVAAEQSYFDTLFGASPLRHTWSLAVEEQWYFLWPLVMIGLCALLRRGRSPDRSSARAGSRVGVAMLAAIVGAAVLSAVVMAILHDPADASRVYFGTDTRAQQLLVGAALAWVVHLRPSLADPARLRRLAVPVNATLASFVVAAAVVGDESSWLYHGGLLALSGVAAVLVLGAAVPGRDGPLRWLTAAPLVALGRRSYGLYLWHWPVIVFVGAPIGIAVDGVRLAALQMLVMLLLTEVSYRLIETPVRLTVRRPVTVVGGWSTAAVGLAVASAVVLVAPPGLAPIQATVVRPAVELYAAPVADEPDVAATDPAPAAEPPGADHERRAETAAPAPIGVSGAAVAADPPPPERRKLLLFGDSTALVLFEYRPDDVPVDWDVGAFARVGCGITPGQTIDPGSSSATIRDNVCDQWVDEWSLYSSVVQPDLAVVMLGAWEVLDYWVDGERIGFPSEAWTAHLTAAVERAVDAARGGNGNPVVLLRLPVMEQSPDSAVSATARNDPARIAAFNAVIESVAAQHAAVSTVALDDLLSPAGTPLRTVDGQAVRSDGVHLTPFGAKLVWTWLADELDRVAPTNPTR